ncbi:T9SS type A sorting domain-containing protein [bacterium]|nr:T9SS type A sorting domain-containing protein [bacterium]
MKKSFSTAGGIEKSRFSRDCLKSGGNYPLFIIALLLIALFGAVFAGWERCYYRPGNGWEYGYSVLQTPDSGYIIVGWSANTGYRIAGDDKFNDSTLPTPTDIYIVRTNPEGDTLWTWAYGTHYGYELCEGHSIIEAYDDGYMVAGHCDYSMFIAKINLSGDILGIDWMHIYSDIMGAKEIEQTPDSGYILVNSVGMDISLTKINADGELLWSQRYGGDGIDEAFSLEVTPDGGYILVGHTNSFGTGSCDIYVVKTDSVGDTIWTRTYGGSGQDFGRSIAKTSDGGYVVAGYTDSFGAGEYDWYLIKLQPSGDTVWTKTYGTDERDKCNFVMQTDDGGFLLAGEFRSETGVGELYIIKTDSTGSIQWERAYGGPHSDEAYWVSKTFDGGYIISGMIDNGSPTFADLYLIKTDSLGNIDWVKNIPKKPKDIEINVFPNPFNSSCEITVPARGEITIYDLQGNTIYKSEFDGKNMIWSPAASIPSGIYLVRAKFSDGTSITKRVFYTK